MTKILQVTRLLRDSIDNHQLTIGFAKRLRNTTEGPEACDRDAKLILLVLFHGADICCTKKLVCALSFHFHLRFVFYSSILLFCLLLNYIIRGWMSLRYEVVCQSGAWSRSTLSSWSCRRSCLRPRLSSDVLLEMISFLVIGFSLIFELFFVLFCFVLFCNAIQCLFDSSHRSH